jgi:hypothetical protein
MALRTALKDRARIVREEADAKRVEGRTIYHPRQQPIFRCRLEITDAPKGRDAAQSVSVVEVPSLTTDRVDAERNPLRFQIDDKIVVESRELAESTDRGWNEVGIFMVDGEPKQIRKKRKVIGWQLRLKRVTESPASPARTG